MDVATETQQAEGIQVMSQFMPAKILPGSMPADEQDDLVKAHKPDIVLYRGNQGAQKKHKYTFVELKYCRDTQPQDQTMRAQEQHHELLQAIQRHSSATNTEIQLVVIPLGVAGTINTSAKKRIKEQLGVTGPPLDTHAKPAYPRSSLTHQDHQVPAHKNGHAHGQAMGTARCSPAGSLHSRKQQQQQQQQSSQK
jgi:hypothetical protein